MTMIPSTKSSIPTSIPSQNYIANHIVYAILTHPFEHILDEQYLHRVHTHDHHVVHKIGRRDERHGWIADAVLPEDFGDAAEGLERVPSELLGRAGGADRQVMVGGFAVVEVGEWVGGGVGSVFGTVGVIGSGAVVVVVEVEIVIQVEVQVV